MNELPRISEINIIPIKPENGLLGFASFLFEEKFYIGSVAIYSRPSGGLRLVYPTKNGLPCCHPIKKEIGAYLEKIIERKYNYITS